MAYEMPEHLYIFIIYELNLMVVYGRVVTSSSQVTEVKQHWAWLYPCSTELLAHPSLVGSKVYFFWSPTEDYCVTVWWIWFVFVDYQVSVWSALSSVIGTFSPHQIMPDTLDTDLIVDKHKSDSSDCDTIVFCRWPEEINFASDEWRMSQKLCGTGVLALGWMTDQCWSYGTGQMQSCRENLSYHATAIHPAVMGTRWNMKAKL